jgi:hypothetical protein
MGDWSTNGQLNIGVFRDGYRYMDSNGNGVWGSGNNVVAFGVAGDIPVVGDWTYSGALRIGVYRVDSAGPGVVVCQPAHLRLIRMPVGRRMAQPRKPWAWSRMSFNQPVVGPYG